jgi:hypothetical protein
MSVRATAAPRRRHGYVPTHGAQELCAKCGTTLEDPRHLALVCACPWRVAGERCVCRRDRDRFGEERCVWCRDGHHLVADVYASSKKVC